MKKILKISFYVITSLIILFNVLSLFNIHLFGLRIYQVKTGSMQPNINVGDMVLVRKSFNYKKGDIITYKNKNEFITHRIVGYSNDRYVTKGDANNTNDIYPVKKKDVVGKVIYKFLIIGKVIDYLRYPISWIVIFFVGLFITFLIPDKEEESEELSK